MNFIEDKLNMKQTIYWRNYMKWDPDWGSINTFFPRKEQDVLTVDLLQGFV